LVSSKKLRSWASRLESTGGLHNAELDREDPLRQVAQSAAFLQASLFTSVVAFGVAGIAVLIGVLFILIDLGIRDVADRRMGYHVTTKVVLGARLWIRSYWPVMEHRGAGVMLVTVPKRHSLEGHECT
jgi:hypothetical protein